MKTLYIPLLILPALLLAAIASAATPPISYVDHELDVSEKYVLRVDGHPFYPTNVQIRLDKLRYWWGWNAAAREAIVAQAALDGFNTVSIPIHWYEVEPAKDRFDWSILDEYLGSACKHGLKVELLWFGQNSGGHVQWLGDPSIDPIHLRTPDYVLHSPKPDSTETTSDYSIKRDSSAYSLDLADDQLRARESFVLGRVMDHIADWDAANGSKHVVVGVQLGNEVRGIKVQFPSSVIVSFMSDLGAAVKKSRYVVWTRLNCVYLDVVSRVEANEALRASSGSNIDFVGVDQYRRHFETERQFVECLRTSAPATGKNYPMIMEMDGAVPFSAVLPFAALSGDTAFDYYEMIGPDNYGLYVRDGRNGFKARGSYIDDVRTVNRLFASAMADLATKANGRGLFVYNWTGDSVATTTGIARIEFTPRSADSQGVAIIHDKTEIVLMTTKGGSFTLPESLGMKKAAKGRFDGSNVWVGEGEVAFTKTSISLPPGVTVLLSR